MSESSSADPKVERLLDAAFAVFMKTGFDKTSMSEIATMAGVSRPTLYRAFATKEDLFLGVAGRLHAATQAAYNEAAAAEGDLSSRLTAMARAKISAHIEVVQSSPHGADLLDLHQRIGGDLAAAADDEFRRLVSATLKAADGTDINLGDHGLSLPRATTIVVSIIDGWERRLLHREPKPTRRWPSELADAVGIVVRGLAPVLNQER